MNRYFQPLVTDRYYHIYNRGNNRDPIFFQDRNYDFFMERFEDFLAPFTRLYCYALLPNHFHLLISIRTPDEWVGLLHPAQHNKFMKMGPSKFISDQFRQFFISYSMAIKKQENRTGSLFEKNFRRKIIPVNNYLTSAINYIHRNPQTHGLVKDFRRYPYHSYNKLLSDNPGLLEQEEIMNWFGGRDEFIHYHKANVIIKKKREVILE